MKLELAYPPGVNTLYGVRATIVKGRPMAFPYKTHEHRAYSAQAKLSAYEAGLTDEQLPCWPKPAQLALRVDLYRPRKAGDIDGPLKTLLDVLQGIVFENDDQVARLEVHRHDDKERPRVELEVTELPGERPTLGELFGPMPMTVKPDTISAQAVAAPKAAMPEPLERRLRRLAKSAVVSNREGGDEPPF